MITLARRGDLHARRQATSFLRSRDVVHKLFADVAPLFKDRPGGYTRIVKIGPRPGDAAEMAYLELVDEEDVARGREARTPEPAVAVAEPEAEAAAEEAGAGDEAEGAEPEVPAEAAPRRPGGGRRAAPRPQARARRAPGARRPPGRG